jgi:hypothetical protein
MAPEPGILGRLSVGSSGGSRKLVQEESSSDDINTKFFADYLIWILLGADYSVDLFLPKLVEKAGLIRAVLLTKLYEIWIADYDCVCCRDPVVRAEYKGCFGHDGFRWDLVRHAGYPRIQKPLTVLSLTLGHNTSSRP